MLITLILVTAAGLAAEEPLPQFIITTVAGDGTREYGGDGGPAKVVANAVHVREVRATLQRVSERLQASCGELRELGEKTGLGEE